MDNIAKSNLMIFHGKFDPVVPVSQSLELYEHIMSKYPDAHVFFDIFDDGHEIDMETSMYWLMSQYQTTKKQQLLGDIYLGFYFSYCDRAFFLPRLNDFRFLQ